MTKYWEKPLNGPDWMDVHRRVLEIQNVHRVTIVIGMSFSGWALAPTFTFSCAAFLPAVPDSDGQEVAGVSGEWPCRDHKTMESCIHNALYQLDFLLGKAYKQQTF